MEKQTVAEIENDVASAIAGELASADDATAAAPAGFSPMHGGPDTIGSIHYAPGTQPMTAGLSGQHDGTGTEPLGAGYNVPADNNADLADIRAQVKKDQAATAESLRRHAKGYVEPSGAVAGIK